MVRKMKKSMMGGASKEILKNPDIKRLADYYKQQVGMGMIRGQVGSGWWDNFVGWLKKNKVLSTVGSIITPIATTFNPAIGTAVGVATKLASSQGFGMMKGRGNGVAFMGGQIGLHGMSGGASVGNYVNPISSMPKF